MNTTTQDNLTTDTPHGSYKPLAAAILTVLAATVGLIAWYKKDEIADEVMSRAKAITKKYKKTRAQIQKDIMEFFGQVTDDLEEKYLEVESDVMAAIDNMKDKTKLTKKAYDQIVEDVVDARAKMNKWSSDSVKKLVANLQGDYQQWKDEMNDTEKVEI